MKTSSLKYLFFIVSLIVTFSCSSEQEPKFTIGFSQCTMSDSWRKNMLEGMERELSFYPEIKMITKDANNQNKTQIKDIQGFIDQKVDLIIASPNESDIITPIIEKAYSAGIPVILVDRRISTDKFTAFVGADNYLVGQNAAIYANSVINGTGNILEVGAGPNTSPSIGRHTGFVETLKKYPNLHYEKMLWTAEKRYDLLERSLKQNPQINFIFAHNDRLALEVYKVCSDLKLTNKIKVVGVDGLSGANEGLDLVKKNKINATILYPTGGEESIQTAVKILKKQEFQKQNNLFTTVISSENVNIMFSQINKIQEQQHDIEQQTAKLKVLNDTYSSQRNRLYFISALLTAVIILGAVLYFLLQEKQHSNKVLAEQNEAILEQKNEIEKVSTMARKATEDKMRFYSYISHEFKTPLSLILTPAEDLLQRKSTDPKETRNTIQLIHKNANRLLRLVNQFLEMRKLDAGKMELQANLHDLVAFIKEIVEDFGVRAKQKHINLQFICPFKELPFLFDAEKLDKVLFNIISNAFKYTPDGGLIHVSILKSLDKIEINIADNGIGMNAEEKEHAFDLFYRGNKNISLGTGLGLALSHEFVNLHGGEIKLDSEKGKGTTFKIVLPIIETNSDLLEKPSILPKNNESFEEFEQKLVSKPISRNIENTLILIEDNPDLNLFLRQKFEGLYNTVAAENAEKGWEEILAYIPDIIICDVMLPVMDGFALTQKVKSDFRTSHIPVVLLTAKSQIESQIEGTKAGADDYIAKPFNQQLLEEKIKGLLGNRDRMRRRFSTEISIPNQLQKGERRFLLEFEELIEKNIKDSTLSVEKLSKELGMSRVQLFRKISALTNKNVTDYIAEYKLNKAKTLLNDHEKNIAEIAYELGFSTPSYFTTFFKQKTDKTPSEWRSV